MGGCELNRYKVSEWNKREPLVVYTCVKTSDSDGEREVDGSAGVVDGLNESNDGE